MASQNTKFFVRQMTPADFDQSLEIFASHGLFEARGTLNSFYTVDPDGFYVAESLEEPGKRIKCILFDLNENISC